MKIEITEKTIETIVKTIAVALVSVLVTGITYIVTSLHGVEKKQDLTDYKLDQINFVLQDIYETKSVKMTYSPWSIKSNSDESITAESTEVITIDEATGK